MRSLYLSHVSDIVNMRWKYPLISSKLWLRELEAQQVKDTVLITLSKTNLSQSNLKHEPTFPRDTLLSVATGFIQHGGHFKKEADGVNSNVVEWFNIKMKYILEFSKTHYLYAPYFSFSVLHNFALQNIFSVPDVADKFVNRQ